MPPMRQRFARLVQRPTTRFVPVKTAEQQASQLLHRGREQLVRQRTMLVNALRAHLAEFGMVATQGLRNVGELIALFATMAIRACLTWRGRCCKYSRIRSSRSRRRLQGWSGSC